MRPGVNFAERSDLARPIPVRVHHDQQVTRLSERDRQLFVAMMDDELPSPTWHKKVLDERRGLVAAGKQQFLNAQSLYYKPRKRL